MNDRQSPLTSIIVAVYNSEATVGRTLESIIAQTYPNKEIVVVDGASTDGTCAVIECYRDRLASYISEPDRGIADAYNKGLGLARGEWIFFLNADDVFMDDDTLSRIFAHGPFDGYDLVVGTVVADTGHVFDGRYSWKLLMKNQVHHQAIFYRATLLRQTPYNIQYRRYGHDHEHNLLLWRRQTPVRYLDIPVALWASGGVSDSAKWKDYREEFRMRRNVLGSAGWPFNVFTLIRYALKRGRIFLRSWRKSAQPF